MPHREDILYVVATPIGNLNDITIRALEVLRSVDTVLTENVPKTRVMLRHHGITARIASYREENAARMGEVALGILRAGRPVALVAEAGTPGVSDPGRRLVDAAWKGGFRVVPVPGASAAVAAVSVSGMEDGRFVFEGFLPRKRSRRRQRLADLAAEERALVFFEAPHRLVECLEDIKHALGDRACVVAREITKLHEEIDKGPVSSFLARFAEREPRGEFVVVCEGRSPAAGAAPAESAGLEAAVREAAELVSGGLKKKLAAKTVAKRYDLDSSEIYRRLTRGGST
ncbi:MAG: 16S rRNA (cytidine(1402)-2'-O)-methyltransferase [bacterium]